MPRSAPPAGRSSHSRAAAWEGSDDDIILEVPRTQSAMSTDGRTNWALRSRKSDANKEIEEWISDVKREKSTVRTSAQPAENYTEQRMLESKLYDLSKERYKFLSQANYQRKAFLDKQHRKTSVMKDLMRKVDSSTSHPSLQRQNSQLSNNDADVMSRKASSIVPAATETTAPPALPTRTSREDLLSSLVQTTQAWQPTADRRFSKLADALSPTYETNKQVNVDHILKRYPDRMSAAGSTATQSTRRPVFGRPRGRNMVI
ncbi:Hypp5070 [Branchiostoma lanceolatum]|uniref:Hypp5070 protein n=1 Tax=Branchiostoma lanceolatum TaxID=7740 RepID=A0A8K0AI75_BRALA|nr:Hypp5070 [Branchiostoma lanceolatum]